MGTGAGSSPGSCDNNGGLQHQSAVLPCPDSHLGFLEVSPGMWSLGIAGSGKDLPGPGSSADTCALVVALSGLFPSGNVCCRETRA